MTPYFPKIKLLIILDTKNPIIAMKFLAKKY